MDDLSPDNGVAQRRALIELTPLPHPRHDAVVTLAESLGPVHIRLRYVPDRDVIVAKTFAAYLRSGLPETSTLVSMAQTILDDVNDQAIPCWVEVMLTREMSGEPKETVCIEEKQPRWQDPGILARLGP